MRKNPRRMNNKHVLGKLDTKRYIAMMQRSDNKYHHNFSNPTVLFKTGNAQWLMERNMDILRNCLLDFAFKSNYKSSDGKRFMMLVGEEQDIASRILMLDGIIKLHNEGKTLYDECFSEWKKPNHYEET